jgi:hypothetical protein
VHLLAHYGDIRTAAAVFAANPALADDTSALGSAAGNEEFLRLMLRYQPDLPKRRTVAGGTRELTELLFRHGMNPSKPDWLGITPLHEFARKGEVENAAIFLDHGADIHARDEDICSTPLGWAAKFGKALMVEFLLRRGARPKLPDDPPWATPLAWATRRGHDRIVALLNQYEEAGRLTAAFSLERCESLARDLVEAYKTGDSGAIQRFKDHFQLNRTPNRDQLREQVRGRLGLSSDTQSENDDLALADAQLLVARSHGFENWSQLRKHIED